MGVTRTSIKITAVILFAVMIIVNVFAKVFSINGMTTYQLFKLYPDLFVPDEYTLYIWVLIYLLLTGFALYQIGLFHHDKKGLEAEILHRIRILFVITSFLNTAWIFAWHYAFIALALTIMIIIFVCLAIINDSICDEDLTMREKLFIRVPFSIYFAWITMIVFSNIIALLVSIGWQSFGKTGEIGTVITIIISAAISLVIIISNKNIIYGLTIIWVYIGILIKHLSQSGFHGDYTVIIRTVIICVVVLLVAGGYVILKSKRN